MNTLLVRHGQSTAQVGAPGEARLTELGHTQARYLPDALGRVSVIAVSPMRRAQETAAPIRERHPGAPVLTWPVQEFTYLEPERLRDTTAADRAGEAEAYWRRGDPNFLDGPGAESFASFMGRARRTVAMVDDLSGGGLVVVCHGWFIRAVIWCLLNPGRTLDESAMRRFRQFCFSTSVPNASVTPIVEYERGSDGRLMRAVGATKFDHVPPEERSE